MNKKLFIIVVIVIVVAFLGIYFFHINKDLKNDAIVDDNDINNEVTVGTFELEKYNDEIDEFFSGEILGPTPSAKDAKEKAVPFLKEVYGEKIKNREPYHVQYDEKNKAWLIQGTLPKGYLGGVPHIIIRQDDGMILAVWHTK